MVKKSISFFVNAIESINRPTLEYRSENFVFNICVAWELLLKAKLVRDLGEDEIYTNKKKNKTIELSKCVDSIFTDYNNPIKHNLKVIIRLRNQATHFVTPEYDGLYISFFQANVLLFVEYIKKEFKVNIKNRFPPNFLTIATNISNIEDVKLLNRLDKQTFNQFLETKKTLIAVRSVEGTTVSFDTNMRLVKKDADITFKYDGNSAESAHVISRLIDPSESHKYRRKEMMIEINSTFGADTINQYSFRAISFFEKLEDSSEYFYYHKQSNNKTYSEKALTLIKKNIKDIPNYTQICLEEYKKK